MEPKHYLRRPELTCTRRCPSKRGSVLCAGSAELRLQREVYVVELGPRALCQGPWLGGPHHLRVVVQEQLVKALSDEMNGFRESHQAVGVEVQSLQVRTPARQG